MEYIPYHCGFQGNTYIPQEVVLLPGEYIYRPGSHAHFLGNIYILQEVSWLQKVTSHLPLRTKGGEAGFTESEAEVAFEEIAAIL